MLMNVSAGCLSTYIRPPVQTVVVSTKQTERFTLLVDAYIRQPVIPIHPSVCQSLPLVLCIIVYLNPSYVQISNEYLNICRLTWLCSSSASKLHPQCPLWAALPELLPPHHQGTDQLQWHCWSQCLLLGSCSRFQIQLAVEWQTLCTQDKMSWMLYTVHMHHLNHNA